MSTLEALSASRRLRSPQMTGLGVVLMSISVSLVTALAASFVATDLGTLGGVTSFPLDINDDKVTVGYSQTASGATHAFRWTKGTGMNDLGTLGGFSSVATAVNARGVVVGVSETADADQHAFLWIEKVGMIDLGTLPHFTQSYATAISDDMAVVGFSSKITETFEMVTHAFAWTRGRGMVDIGTFGGNTYPNAVNTKGMVVGTSYTSGSEESRPFAWTHTGGMIDLGSLGGRFGEALAVSDSG